MTHHHETGPESKAMLSQLRSIFDVIVSYKTAQESLYESGTEELERRDRDESKVSDPNNTLTYPTGI